MTDANAPRPSRDAAPSGREALRRQVTAGFRRALGLTALGTVIPGAGLTQTRSKRLGWAILALFLLTGVVVGYIVLRDGITNAALSLVARPSLLAGRRGRLRRHRHPLVRLDHPHRDPDAGPTGSTAPAPAPWPR